MTDNRQKDDWYPTPPSATAALLSREKFGKTIWEPAAGDGAIAKVCEKAGYDVVASDLNDYGYMDALTNVDFLLEPERAADHLITNPPYKLAQEFIQKAIDLGCTKHAWLLRLAFLEGSKRYWGLFAGNPPARIYVFSHRLTMIRGDHDESWYGSGKMAFAWFVWDSACRGDDPQLFWVPEK